jgi:hypothetical protein
VWNPTSVCLERDIEKVQRRFTKKLRGMSALSYEDRLQHLRLDKLSTRRQCIDLVTAYKALHGNLDISPASIGVELSHAPTRANATGLVVRRAASTLTAKSFNFHISKHWNELPAVTQRAASVHVFKRRLLKF